MALASTPEPDQGYKGDLNPEAQNILALISTPDLLEIYLNQHCADIAAIEAFFAESGYTCRVNFATVTCGWGRKLGPEHKRDATHCCLVFGDKILGIDVGSENRYCISVDAQDRSRLTPEEVREISFLVACLGGVLSKRCEEALPQDIRSRLGTIPDMLRTVPERIAYVLGDQKNHLTGPAG